MGTESVDTRYVLPYILCCMTSTVSVKRAEGVVWCGQELSVDDITPLIGRVEGKLTTAAAVMSPRHMLAMCRSLDVNRYK